MGTYRLNWMEMMHAANVGVARNLSAIKKGRQLEPGRTDVGYERHILGAIGEYAVSLELGVPWRPEIGKLDKNEGDVDGYQVRATTRPNGCLIVKPEDDPDHTFVLVIVNGFHVRVIGSILGRNARLEGFWKAKDKVPGVHQSAWFVPQNVLRPLTTLALEAAA